MEKLLNKLIEMGWKPRGEKITNPNYCPLNEYTSINDLCSIDSGLRQFVVKNELYDDNFEYIEQFTYENIEYRLMRSVIQLDKEKFLLDNIILGR